MKSTRLAALTVSLLFGALACGDDTTATSGSGGSSGSAGGDGAGGEASSPSSTGTGSEGGATSSTTTTGSATSSTGAGGSQACGELAPADRDRFVVVGRPTFPMYEVLSLSQSGELSATGKTFTMLEPNDQEIAFTPDGSIGVVVQEGGSLGIFRLAEDGTPTVIEAEFQPGGNMEFYASSVVMAPSGDHLIVANPNWPDSGGGLYRVDLDCKTGAATLVGKQIQTKNAWGLLSLGGDRWAVAGKAAGDVEDATDVFDLRAGAPWTRAGGVDAFDYDDSVPGGFAAARDGSFLLVGDISEFSGELTHLRMVTIDGTGFALAGEDLQFRDPHSILVGPSGDVALVASGYGNALVIFDVDPSAEQPLSARGVVDYIKGPQLPGKMVMVQRGALDGLVLGIDVEGVRKVRFVGDDVIDDGVFAVGEGVDGLIAGIGVQP